MTGLLNEAEGKNIKLSKDVSSLSSQLQDAQVRDTLTAKYWDVWSQIPKRCARSPAAPPLSGAAVGGDASEAESVWASASDGGGQEQPDGAAGGGD